MMPGMPALLLFIGLGAVSQVQVINMAMQIHDKTHALRTQSLLFLLLPIAAWLGSSYGLLGLIIGIILVNWLRYIIAVCCMGRQGIDIDLDKAGMARMLWSEPAGSWGWWFDGLSVRSMGCIGYYSVHFSRRHSFGSAAQSCR